MLKYIFIIIMLLFYSPSVMATAYYFNLASGDDTTGDGTSGNPWKTIDKCTTSRSAGDECRGAKTTITTLSGTLTFTNGSTSVNTTVDQTGTVAAGDIIGKNSGLEGWWKVSSLTSSVITLTSQYWGLSGSGSAVTGYKITPVTASEEYDMATDGSSGNRIKVSGGWDLTGPTQNGITAFSGNYANAIDFVAKDYIELSKFIIVGTSNVTSALIYLNNAAYPYLHDIWLVDAVGSYGHIYIAGASYSPDLRNVVMSGGTAEGLQISVQSDAYLESVYLMSVGTGTGDDSVLLTSIVGGVFKDLRIYNAYNFPLRVSTESSGNVFNDLIIDTNRAAGISAVRFGVSAYENRFYNPTISGVTGYVSYHNDAGSPNNYFIGGSVTATQGNFYSTAQTSILPFVTIKNSGSDSIMYWTNGTIEHDSSADCRSGNCLKFTPSHAYYSLIYKVGNVKIPSAGSNLTLYVYLKDDSSFNGTVKLRVLRNAKFISDSTITPTTSYVQQSVVVSSSDLVANEYLDLYVIVTGTAGNLFVDDFSASQ